MGTYGLAAGQWVLAAGEGAFALGSLTVVVRALPVRRAAPRLVGCAAAVGLAYAVLGAGGCLLLGTAASVAARAAQVVAVLRAGTAAGVSSSTWAVLAAANAAWGVTGLLSADPLFAATAAGGSLASLAVVATCARVSRG